MEKIFLTLSEKLYFAYKNIENKEMFVRKDQDLL